MASRRLVRQEKLRGGGNEVRERFHRVVAGDERDVFGRVGAVFGWDLDGLSL